MQPAEVDIDTLIEASPIVQGPVVQIQVHREIWVEPGAHKNLVAAKKIRAKEARRESIQPDLVEPQNDKKVLKRGVNEMKRIDVGDITEGRLGRIYWRVDE